MNKKINASFILMLFILGIFAVPVSAFNPPGVRMTKLYASGVIVAAPCRMLKITLTVNATNDGTLLIYDSATAASGTVLYNATKTKPSAGRMTYEIDFPQIGVYAAYGLYASLSGGAREVIVYYDE